MSHPALVYPTLFDNGDRLSREEFLELWERMPAVKFAELIDGTVHMPSPLSEEHARNDSKIHLVLTTYSAFTGVCEVLSNATWLMLDSAPQPDASMRLFPQYGGASGSTGLLASGRPELVAEVSRSSRSYDLGPKLALYQRAGVAEYVVILIEERRVEWRVLIDGSYRILQPDGQGVLKSRVFPGLWLSTEAFWTNNLKGLMDAVHQGLNSPECASFLAGLRA